MSEFILTQGSCISQTNQIPKAMQMTEYIRRIIFSIYLPREHRARKCLHTVTKVSARLDSKMATQTTVYFSKAKQNKTKQNLIWYTYKV
jgi:hypothetical protein